MVSKHYHAEGRTKVVSNFSELAPEAALEEETRVGVQLNETVMELAGQFSEVIAQPLRYTKVYLVTEKVSGKTFFSETQERYYKGAVYQQVFCGEKGTLQESNHDDKSL